MAGGKRPGAGRPKGAKNKRQKELLDQTQKRVEAVLGAAAFEGDAHTLLMSIYRDKAQPIDLRMDAAKACIGYEKPKLAAIEHSGEIRQHDVSDLSEAELSAELARVRAAIAGEADQGAGPQDDAELH